jgi:hypothetical protein
VGILRDLPFIVLFKNYLACSLPKYFLKMAYKTRFTPKNRHKYVGTKTELLCRSLWERRVCKFLDESTSVTKWSFEEIEIPYVHPIDKKVHRYIPDFLVQTERNNKKKSILVEVKPKKQVKLRESASKRDQIVFQINKAKWTAAQKFCEKHDIEFKILTEEEIFHGS